MAENETLATAAPDLAPEITDAELGFEPVAVEMVEEVGKPAESEAVPATEDTAKTPESPAMQETSPTPPPRKWAGKYDAPEAMEQGYLNATAEATRLAQELAELKKAATPPGKVETTPTYTVEQLEDFKAEYLLRLGDLTASAREARALGDAEKADNVMRDAAKVSRQIVLCDNALSDAKVQHRENTVKRESAHGRAREVAQKAVSPFKANMVDGDPLLQASSEIHRTLIDAGMPDIDLTMAAAVALAKLSSTTNAATTPAGKPATATQLMDTANKAFRQLPQGAGGAVTPSSTIPDFLNDKEMPDDKFMEWDRKHMGVNW